MLNVFVISVVVSDLLFLMIILLFYIVVNVYGKWIYEEEGCKVVVFIIFLLGLIFLMYLVVVFYERYVVVVFLFISCRIVIF